MSICAVASVLSSLQVAINWFIAQCKLILLNRALIIKFKAT